MAVNVWRLGGVRVIVFLLAEAGHAILGRCLAAV
jgi:hypothetical protein